MLRFIAALFLAAGMIASMPGYDQRFSFGLWGDMPYTKANDAPKIPRLIADMNASDIRFSIYDGDSV